MGGKKGRQTACKTAKSDFTLNDFANAPVDVAKTGRMKKGEARACNTADPGQVSVEPVVEVEELAWYEKDLSDFEIHDEESAEKHEKELNAAMSVRSRTRRRRGKHSLSLSESQADDDNGIIYPLDLWCIIGSYIFPEDVTTFSRLSRGAHIVSHTAKFWRTMYKRFYKLVPDLPPLLQPASISHVHGLRTRVIRSLFYTYPPFQQRSSSRQLFDRDPDVLTGARCTLQWHQKVKAGWHFYFKFTFTNTSHCCLMKGGDASDLLADIDVFTNPEENCCVLQVVSSSFISLPMVMGKVLTKTFISVGHQMRYHKLKLLFNAEFNARRQMTTGTAIIMDPVLNVLVQHWWNTKYPYNTS